MTPHKPVAPPTFEEFFNGEPIHYLGLDNAQYVATVKPSPLFGEIKHTIVTRADGVPIKARNGGVLRTYRKGFEVGHGEWSARMMYEEAVAHPVTDAMVGAA
jgi:hypothetical protein